MPRKGSTKGKSTPKSKTSSKKPSTPKKQCEVWNDFDEAKLLKLFQTEAVGLNDINPPAIHKVIEQYFPERPYTSFGPLYKRKLRNYNIDQLKSGQRRETASTKPSASKRAKTVPTQIHLEEDSSEDETWHPDSATILTGDEETTFLGEDVSEVIKDNYSVDLAEESEEEEEEEDDYDLPDISKMSIRSYKSFSFKFESPFIIYPYTENRQKKVCVDFLVHSMPRESFKLHFNSSGTQVLLYTKVPKMFTSNTRVMDVDQTLGDDNIKTVSFDEVVAETVDKQDEDDEMYGSPQIISFPFACNTTIPIIPELQAFEGWNIPASRNPLDPGDTQFYRILSINVESKQKAMKRVQRKTMKIFKSGVY